MYFHDKIIRFYQKKEYTILKPFGVNTLKFLKDSKIEENIQEQKNQPNQEGTFKAHYPRYQLFKDFCKYGYLDSAKSSRWIANRMLTDLLAMVKTKNKKGEFRLTESIRTTTAAFRVFGKNAVPFFLITIRLGGGHPSYSNLVMKDQTKKTPKVFTPDEYERLAHDFYQEELQGKEPRNTAEEKRVDQRVELLMRDAYINKSEYYFVQDEFKKYFRRFFSSFYIGFHLSPNAFHDQTQKVSSENPLVDPHFHVIVPLLSTHCPPGKVSSKDDFFLVDFEYFEWHFKKTFIRNRHPFSFAPNLFVDEQLIEEPALPDFSEWHLRSFHTQSKKRMDVWNKKKGKWLYSSHQTETDLKQAVGYIQKNTFLKLGKEGGDALSRVKPLSKDEQPKYKIKRYRNRFVTNTYTLGEMFNLYRACKQVTFNPGNIGFFKKKTAKSIEERLGADFNAFHHKALLASQRGDERFADIQTICAMGLDEFNCNLVDWVVRADPIPQIVKKFDSRSSRLPLVGYCTFLRYSEEDGWDMAELFKAEGLPVPSGLTHNYWEAHSAWCCYMRINRLRSTKK